MEVFMIRLLAPVAVLAGALFTPAPAQAATPASTSTSYTVVLTSETFSCRPGRPNTFEEHGVLTVSWPFDNGNVPTLGGTLLGPAPADAIAAQKQCDDALVSIASALESAGQRLEVTVQENDETGVDLDWVYHDGQYGLFCVEVVAQYLQFTLLDISFQGSAAWILQTTPPTEPNQCSSAKQN
jgi:hypothetical protein